VAPDRRRGDTRDGAGHGMSRSRGKVAWHRAGAAAAELGRGQQLPGAAGLVSARAEVSPYCPSLEQTLGHFPPPIQTHRCQTPLCPPQPGSREGGGWRGAEGSALLAQPQERVRRAGRRPLELRCLPGRATPASSTLGLASARGPCLPAHSSARRRGNAPRRSRPGVLQDSSSSERSVSGASFHNVRSQ